MPGQIDKRFKIIGITLFSLVFFINPFVYTPLSRHFFIFSTVFLILGLFFYFEIFGLGRKIVTLFRYLESHSGWKLLIAQSIIFILYCLINKDYLSYPLHAGQWDEPSYTGFDFSSWQSVLGSIRTAGLPILLQIYHVVFKELNFWPHFQMISYVLSIFFLYNCFLKFGFNRILALFVVSLLLWDTANYEQFMNVETESFAATFLHLTIGSMLLAVRKWSWKTAVPLGIIVFSLYLIRPNLSFIPILIPIWVVGISTISEGFDLVRGRRIFVRFSLCTILPFMLFCLLRLAVVGQFGVASLIGGNLAGHAAHYLNEVNIQYLSGDMRKLADEILVRKRQLSSPNNLSPFEWIKIISEPEKIEMQAKGFNPVLMTAWNVAIKQLNGVEPFVDSKKNIESWEHAKTMADFYTRNYTLETDRLLTRFAKEILSREWKRYGHWLVGGSFYGMREYWKGFSWLVWLGLLGIAKLFYLLFAEGLDTAKLKRWHQEIGILTMIAGSIFIIGFLPLVAFNFPQVRYLNLIGIYLLPVFVCLTLPPFWLKQERVKEIV